jgi:Tol biopolymer transport system component
MKSKRLILLKKVLYGLGALVILAVVFGLAMFFWPYPQNNYPSWSPDSTRIAFTRHSEMWVVNADGSNRTKLLDNGMCPAWSPDGTEIAFISKESYIWLMDTNGSNQRKLMPDAGALLTLAWSPDGTKIAFDSPIQVVNADGSDKRILSAIAEDFHPAWSPDGTKIAFQSSSGRNTDIWVMNADGSNQTKLLDNGMCPVWSPDGKITFIGEGGICIMNADGSDQKILMSVDAGSLAWSPDSSKIAFVSDVASGTDIWVINADGTNQVKLIK